MTTLQKLAAVQRKFMYRERGRVPEFEKQLRKTDPFATEVTWKFLPGLVCRQCALTPSLCRGVLLFQCSLVPFKRSGGWGGITWPFPVAPSPAEEVPALFPPAYHSHPCSASQPHSCVSLWPGNSLCGSSVQ